MAERLSQYAEGQYVRDPGGKWWKVYHVTRDAMGRLYLVLDGSAGHAALREPDIAASSDRKPSGFSTPAARAARMARSSGYVYRLEGNADWRSASDDDWETIAASVDGPVVGRRRIDGAEVVVIEQGGRFYAALPQNVAMGATAGAGASSTRRGEFGPLVRLDNLRDDGGKVRVGLWDRAATYGKKPKDGVESEFTVETFGQMIDNWLARGERLSLCYNHQSAYTEQNGEPAPALAYYDAAAIVKDGQVVRFEKLRVSNAAQPEPAALNAAVAVLATNENPDPSPDGLWWYRCEVTEPIGQLLLPTFKYLSPMFVPEGQNEFGQSQGYTIYDLAATNTAFQAGCILCFERDGHRSVQVLSEDVQMGALAMCPECGKQVQVVNGRYAPHDVGESGSGTCPESGRPIVIRRLAMEVKIERTSAGRWRVFVEEPDGFRVVGEYATEEEAKRAAARAPERGFATMASGWVECPVCGADVKPSSTGTIPWHTAQGEMSGTCTGSGRKAQGFTTMARSVGEQVYLEGEANPCTIVADLGEADTGEVRGGAWVKDRRYRVRDAQGREFTVLGSPIGRFATTGRIQKLGVTMAYFGPGDRLRIDRDLKQVGWTAPVKGGTAGTVVEVKDGSFGTVLYKVRWDDGQENWLGNAHLVATKLSIPPGTTMARDVRGQQLAVGDRVSIDKVGEGSVVEVSADSIKVRVPGATPEVESFSPREIDFWQVTKLSKSGGTTMAKKFDEEMAKRLGLDEGADAGAVKKAYARRMAEASGLLASEDDDKKLADEARRLDEEAAAYEAAFGDDGDEDKPHVGMRRLAAKMRRMAKMDEPAAPAAEPPAGMEAPAEEADEKEFVGRMKAEGVPDDEAKQMARMGQRFGLDLRRATRRTIFAAAAAGSVPAERVESMVKQKLDEALAGERQKRERQQRVDQATALFEAAVAGGYPADMREEFVTFATTNLDAAKKVFASYLKQGAQLFERVTHAGAPAGGARGGSGTASTVIRQHGAVRVVKYACDFAAEARKLAREKNIKYEAALDQVMREKPELYEQYLHQSS